MKQILDAISSPSDLKKLDVASLPKLCEEIREYIIETLSETGGHFASNLGVVELTVVLHYVLNTPLDRLIWDVGHQTYTHKILTGRKENLRSIRLYGGISGFPKREESPYDLYNTGHAGTSISQLLGEAVARDLNHESYKCLAVIGDASIATGMSFESLNHGGHLKNDCVVILNDNDMSISHNVGAFNQYLNRLITSSVYNRWRGFWYRLVILFPLIGPVLKMFSKKMEKIAKDLLMPGSLFHDFGFRYIGPVDGHDIHELIRVIGKAVEMKGPILVHVLTQKGKGYKPAENNPTLYHSVSQFDRKNGQFSSDKKGGISFSDLVGKTLCELAEKEKKIVAITPAMIEGSGLREFASRFPERLFDVGIAEQHAVSFAGALASGGMIPFLCIYSTFLTRGLDQLIEDVALMNLPVRIVIDRAGCVGPDGETHQGLFDLGFLLATPNIRVYAPANGNELRAFLGYMAEEQAGPIAIRFPKGDTPVGEPKEPSFDVRAIQPQVAGNGNDIAILCIGNMWQTGLSIQTELEAEHRIGATVVGIRWLRPLDIESIERVLERVTTFVFLEESYLHASASSLILGRLSSVSLEKFGRIYAFPDEPIVQGSRSEVFKHYGLDVDSVVSDIKSYKIFRRKNLSAITHSTETV